VELSGHERALLFELFPDVLERAPDRLKCGVSAVNREGPEFEEVQERERE